MSLFTKLFPKITARSTIAGLETEIWATDPERAQALVESLRHRLNSTTAAELRSLREMMAGDRPLYTNVDGVAHVRVEGDLYDSVPWIAEAFGERATGYDELRAAMHTAVEDPDVGSVLLVIDSPGGMTSGLSALANDVFALREKKPIHAHAVGDVASAAYWLGAQASTFTAEATSRAGSIGTMALIPDTSRRADMQGVRMHVVKSGPLKGAGAPGTQVTLEQLQPIQEHVNDVTETFKAAVARGRGVDLAKVEGWSSGRSWTAPQAAELGLIDGVSSLEAAHTRALGPNQSRIAPGVGAPTIAREGGEPAAKEIAAIQEDQQMSKEELSALTARLDAVEAREKNKDAEIAALKAKNAELEAETKARAAANAEITKGQKLAAIAAGVKSGRVVGDMVAAVTAYSETLGTEPGAVAKLESFIASLPVQVTPKALGKNDDQGTGGSSNNLAASDDAVMRALGLTPAQMQAAGSVDFVSLDGQSGVKITGHDAKGEPIRARVQLGKAVS